MTNKQLLKQLPHIIEAMASMYAGLETKNGTFIGAFNGEAVYFKNGRKSSKPLSELVLPLKNPLFMDIETRKELGILFKIDHFYMTPPDQVINIIKQLNGFEIHARVIALLCRKGYDIYLLPSTMVQYIE